jgi:glutathione S-transferase
MSTRITLYGVAITPYTIKVTRALHWKGLPFVLEEPASAEDYRRWSPKNGLLPVIDVDGTRVQDSAAILDLLDERFPEPPLLSSDPKLAHDQRGLERWVGEAFFFHLLRWVRSRLGPGAAPQAGIGPLMRVGLIGPDGLLRREVIERESRTSLPEFEGALGEMTKLLGARTWYFADQMSRADLAVFAALQGLVHDRYPGAAELLRAYPTLLRHSERVEAATQPRV